MKETVDVPSNSAGPMVLSNVPSSPLTHPTVQRIMRTVMCRAFVVFVLVVVGFGTSNAEELPKPKNPDAQAHVKAGNEAFALKEFDLAIREYRAAAALETGSPAIVTLWWNLGQAYRLKGSYEDSIWFYRQFLKTAPLSLPMFRQQAETFIREMEAEQQRAAMKLEPTTPGPTQSMEANRIQEPPPNEMKETRSSPWHSDRLGWGIAGSGVVALGVGAWLLSSGASLDDQANEPERSQSMRMELRERADSRRTFGYVLGGAGAALAVAGALKLSINGSDGRDGIAQLSLAPHGIVVSGRF